MRRQRTLIMEYQAQYLARDALAARFPSDQPLAELLAVRGRFEEDFQSPEIRKVDWKNTHGDGQSQALCSIRRRTLPSFLSAWKS